jgi:hypothetical protein
MSKPLDLKKRLKELEKLRSYQLEQTDYERKIIQEYQNKPKSERANFKRDLKFRKDGVRIDKRCRASRKIRNKE